MAIRTAGVIGLNRGRAHIDALRRSGVEVRMVCDQDLLAAQRVSDELMIEGATSRPEDLRELDLVVIATRPETHSHLLALFPNQVLLCEQPLFGIYSCIIQPIQDRAQVFVHHPFLFAKTVCRVNSILDRLGTIRTCSVRTQMQLCGARPRDWLTTVVSEPFAWVLHTLGPTLPVLEVGHRGYMRVELQTLRGARVVVELEQAERQDIEHRVELTGDDGSLAFTAQIDSTEDWRFGPIQSDIDANDDHNKSSDTWEQANDAAIARLIRHLNEDEPLQNGLADGLFDIPKALCLEHALY